MDTRIWSDHEQLVFVLTSYFIILGFILGIALALCNVVKFSRSQKHGNCSYHPMMIFYLWIIQDFISNILWLIFSVRAADYPMPLIIFMPGTSKVLIGIEQIWLMVELIVELNIAK